MTVIHNRQEDEIYGQAAGQDRKCTLCTEPLDYPFLHWHGDGDLYFCTRCCGSLKGGFTADLIEIDAIRKLQSIYGTRLTFVRRHSHALHKPGPFETGFQT